MIITFSGMVGSGKTTAARQIAAALQAHGMRTEHVRFRSLKLVPWPWRSQRSTERATSAPSGQPRAHDFRVRKLSLGRAVGYLGRVMAFRLFPPRAVGREVLLFDRYFYDSFVHYELTSRTERAAMWTLRRLIPPPDLAVLLVASVETLRVRRADYAEHYLVAATEGYAKVRRLFPELTLVHTDDSEAATRQLQDAAAELVSRRRSTAMRD